MSRSSLLFLLLVLLGSAGQPVAAGPRRDFSSQYQLQHRVQAETRREADSLHIYLRFADGSALQRRQPLQVAAWPSFDARRPLWQDTVRHLARRIRRVGAAAWVEFALPARLLLPGQVLSVTKASRDEAASGEGVWLLLTPERLNRSFILTDSLGNPLLRRVIHSGEAISVDTYGPEVGFTAKRYATNNFSAALPPMTNPATQPAPPRTLTLLDSLDFRGGQIVRLTQPGLYAFRVGPAAAPLGLLVEEHNFPKLETAAELIQPLIYLTTSAERKKLYAASDPKRAIDNFWLEAANGNQALGRQMIRTYYDRVEAANELFSAHKAGWMTDRGLLYIVMGPPDAVYRTAAEERWVYHEATTGSGSYTFRPKPSTFAPEHYELVRRPEYEMPWYAAVEQWRKAQTARTGR